MTIIETVEAYEQKILGLIGLAAKAGQLVKGTDAVLEGLANGKVHLVIVAVDAGKVVSADVTASCTANGVPGYRCKVLDKEKLGALMGRAALAVIGITSINFARGIENIFNANLSSAD